MTRSEFERRLATVEQQGHALRIGLDAERRKVSELRTEIATLNILVGVLLEAGRTGSADVQKVAESAEVIRQAAPRPRPSRSAHLRLVDDAGVDGRFLDEGLRRVRAARGEGR